MWLYYLVVTVIPAIASTGKKCIKPLSSACIFPQHFIMKFFNLQKSWKNFTVNIQIFIFYHWHLLYHILLYHISVHPFIYLFLCVLARRGDLFKSRFINVFSFVKNTHTETCKTTKREEPTNNVWPSLTPFYLNWWFKNVPLSLVGLSVLFPPFF